jgi:hypothetical protein
MISKQEMLQLRSAFVIFYPSCFVASGAPKRPLKIGIKQDMLARARQEFPGLGHRHIRSFLTDYTSGKHYFECCREGVARVDLDGAFSGFVTRQDAEFADRCLLLIKQRKNPVHARFPTGPQSIGEIAAKVVNDVMPASYSEWAQKNRTAVAEAFGVPSALLQAPPETLEERLARLESAQYAASMSNNFYYTDGSKARDDAEIADVRRQIAGQKIVAHAR